jgi:hypothetical protein
MNYYLISIPVKTWVFRNEDKAREFYFYLCGHYDKHDIDFCSCDDISQYDGEELNWEYEE